MQKLLLLCIYFSYFFFHLSCSQKSENSQNLHTSVLDSKKKLCGGEYLPSYFEEGKKEEKKIDKKLGKELDKIIAREENNLDIITNQYLKNLFPNLEPQVLRNFFEKYAKIKGEGAYKYKGLEMCACGSFELKERLYITALQVDKIQGTCQNPAEEIAHTSLGIGGGLQAYLLISLLRSHNYKKINYYGIEGQHSKKEIQKLKAFFPKEEVNIHVSPNLDHYLDLVRAGKILRSHSFDMIDIGGAEIIEGDLIKGRDNKFHYFEFGAESFNSLKKYDLSGDFDFSHLRLSYKQTNVFYLNMLWRDGKRKFYITDENPSYKKELVPIIRPLAENILKMKRPSKKNILQLLMDLRVKKFTPFDDDTRYEYFSKMNEVLKEKYRFLVTLSYVGPFDFASIINEAKHIKNPVIYVGTGGERPSEKGMIHEYEKSYTDYKRFIPFPDYNGGL